ncbi:DUF4369 domain-containing protein [Bacteroides sp. 224]|uniref:DUF4369 domain-containing protein n=1 Tax=Bacteroides sp. 224 TaxID=2302936 RepID=UPI0013D8A124|nr:DUF4369 domain-containing protein [Bacteroides sp. 224]NDV67151.1 DUF4369 domain-containing protein [Bacteroides sp. 224]
MNKFLSLIFLLPFFASCGNKYRIEGTSSINEFDGKMVYLKASQGDSVINVDSAEVVHGVFKLKGQSDSIMMVTLFLDNEGIMPLVMENGDIKITIAYDKVSASGTPLNNALYGFIDKRNELELKLEDLDRKGARMVLDGLDIDDVQPQIDKEQEELLDEMNEHVKKFISSNYETVLGPSVFMMLCSGLPYPIMTPQIEDILKDAPYSFKSNRAVKEFIKKAKENMELINEHRRLQDSEAGTVK